jgi:hypothetical protein
MVTVTAMATTTIAMIDCCSVYNRDVTIVAIIYILFLYSMKMGQRLCEQKGNRREEGNRGLVYYYQDGDGNGNGNGNCLR